MLSLHASLHASVQGAGASVLSRITGILPPDPQPTPAPALSAPAIATGGIDKSRPLPPTWSDGSIRFLPQGSGAQAERIGDAGSAPDVRPG